MYSDNPLKEAIRITCPTCGKGPGKRCNYAPLGVDILHSKRIAAYFSLMKKLTSAGDRR